MPKAKKKSKAKKDTKAKSPKKTKTMPGTVYYPKITVIGIGGGGSSIVSDIAKAITKKRIPHLNKIKFVAANVDAQALKETAKQAKSFHFGEELTGGLGCGMNPGLGEQAALQAKNRISQLIRGSDLCIFISCLGGGTGSGATPIFAQVAKELNILSWGIFTKPFSFEGKDRAQIVANSLRALEPRLKAITIFPNQRIFKIVDEKTPVHKSLSAMNEILVETLQGLIETLYLPGLINLDFSDIKAILESGKNLAYVYSQEFSGANRAPKSIEAILNNPLSTYNIAGADRILFNIAGAKDLKMSEIEEVCKKISISNPRAKIIFGISQDNHYKNQLKITLMALGCGLQKTKTTSAKSQAQAQTQTQAKPRPKPKKTRAKKTAKKPSKTKKQKKSVKKKKLVQPKKKKPETKKTKKTSSRKQVPKIKKKDTIRRNALDLHKQVEEDVQKMLEEESKWDVPSFLRDKEND